MGRVLTKVRSGYLDIGEQEWTSSLASEFSARSCFGILVHGGFGGRVRDIDLSFVRDVPGVRGVSVLGLVKDCSALSEVRSLEELSLPVDYRKPFRFDRLGRLRSLGSPYLDTASMASLASLTELRELRLNFWPKTEPRLDILGRHDQLDILRIEFKRGAEMVVGELEADRLRELLLYDGRLVDPSDLGRFGRVEILRLLGTKVATIDFARTMPHLRELVLENCGHVESLAPLRQHPMLEHVAINGSTTVVDGDLTPLLDLPRSTHGG